MKVDENPLRDVLRLLVWYPLRWFIGWLPARYGIRLLQCLGDIHYYSSRKKKRQLRETCARLPLAAADVARIVREYFRNHYVDQLFILVFPQIGVAEIDQLVEFEGLENLDHALALQRGAVLVHGHFGPAHLPLVVLARLGYAMKQIGNPSDAGLSWVGRNVAFRLRMRYEAMMPAEIIKVGSFLRPVFIALKQNQVVMATGDGSGREDEFGRHHEYSLLGQNRRIPLGPALLAEKTGAALLPLFVLPGQKKMFRIIIGVQLTAPGLGKERAVGLMQAFLTQYEEHIWRFPGYMHFLDRLSVHSGNQGYR